MSRSYRKYPLKWVASNKRCKMMANRNLRRKVKIAIKSGRKFLPLLREVSNIWDFNSEYKWYFGNRTDKNIYLRK